LRETNIGVDPAMISQDWEVLLRNTEAQIDHGTYPAEEIGVRLHRSMLSIHPFMNGNGRHARITANELARLLGLGDDLYSWGRRSGEEHEAVRRKYLDALQLADAEGQYGPLVAVALS
jgi:fido (protein-threonine AMPylation protein)